MPFTLEVGFPDEDNWIPLLLPDERVEDWVEEACTAWEVPEHLLETYRTVLTWHAERFRELDVHRGALWVPDVEAGVVATWSIDYGNWLEQAEVDLDEVEKATRDRERPAGVNKPEVTRVDLPAGPAVRSREFDLAPDDPTGGDTTLAESVNHLVFPEGLHDEDGPQLMLWQRVTWTEVVHGDELAGLADEIAELIVVRED
jgi:hypothetical protein